jgi:hypothetical protein
MKKFSKKSVLLFAAVMSLSAFAMPSMASALSWSPIGGADHVLHSSDLTFTTDPAPSVGSKCVTATFTAAVDNANILTITATTFTNCMGIGAAANCTATPTGGNFPWIVTATNPVEIHNVDVTVQLENTPGNPTACATPVTTTLTGTLRFGTWSNATHAITYTGATGLTSDANGLTATVSGTIADLAAPFITLS